MKGHIFHFISVYAPYNKSREKRELFFEDLQDTLDKISNNERIFIMGDLNSRIGNTPISSCNNLSRIPSIIMETC